MVFRRWSIFGLSIAVSCCGVSALSPAFPSPVAFSRAVFADSSGSRPMLSLQNRDDKKDKPDDKKKEPRYIDKKPKDDDRKNDKKDERKPNDW